VVVVPRPSPADRSPPPYRAGRRAPDPVPMSVPWSRCGAGPSPRASSSALRRVKPHGASADLRIAPGRGIRLPATVEPLHCVPANPPAPRRSGVVRTSGLANAGCAPCQVDRSPSGAPMVVVRRSRHRRAPDLHGRGSSAPRRVCALAGRSPFVARVRASRTLGSIPHRGAPPNPLVRRCPTAFPSLVHDDACFGPGHEARCRDEVWDGCHSRSPISRSTPRWGSRVARKGRDARFGERPRRCRESPSGAVACRRARQCLVACLPIRGVVAIAAWLHRGVLVCAVPNVTRLSATGTGPTSLCRVAHGAAGQREVQHGQSTGRPPHATSVALAPAGVAAPRSVGHASAPADHGACTTGDVPRETSRSRSRVLAVADSWRAP